MVNTDVAVTGIGWITPLGSEINEVWDKLYSGDTAFKKYPHKYNLRNYKCALISDSTDIYNKINGITFSAIESACKNACVNTNDKRLKIIIGTSLGPWPEMNDRVSFKKWENDIRYSLGLGHPPTIVSSACSSGSDAVSIGSYLLKSNYYDTVICGGTDIVTPSKRLAHSALSTMTPTIPRAFDSNRNGMLLGEAAAFVVLKNVKSLSKESAPMGLILGSGQSNDAQGGTSPDQTGYGVSLAIQRALKASKVEPKDISAIQAHGSGTYVNDMTEAKAINKIFGNSSPLVFSTKSALGHSLGATGAVELITLLLALKKGVALPNANINTLDHSLNINIASKHKNKIHGNVGISLTLGFGGFNTCIVAKNVGTRDRKLW